MSVARRFAAALSVVGLGVLAYAVPAAAAPDEDRPAAGACADAAVPGSLAGTVDPATGTAVVTGKDGKPLCAGSTAAVTLSTYEVPWDWDGTPFPGGKDTGRAWPQRSTAHSSATIAGDRLELTVPVPSPPCGNVLIAVYTGPARDTVGADGWGGQLLAGWMWSIAPATGTRPTPCGATGDAAVRAEKPAPVPTTAPPSPTATATATASPGPSVTATSKAPVPVTTAPPATATTGAPTTSAAPAPAARVTTPPVAVPPPAAAPAPELAKTGSDGTIPMLVVGGLLLVAGVVLTLVGRRRRAG
jgi:LPXTG-motif cell wall-anchored protein